MPPVAQAAGLGEAMNYPRRNLTLGALALCLLLTMVVSPALSKPQAASSDTNSDTVKKPKTRRNKKLITTESAAEPASAAPAATSAASTSEANPNSATPAPPTSATVPRKAKVESGNTSSGIAAAKAGGKVWVNMDSGIYHKGGRWYGKTKNGKFMTEAEAKAAGYKQSRRD